MNASASSDAERGGHISRDLRDSPEKDTLNKAPLSIDYVRDGATTAHKRGVSGSLLSKLGVTESPTNESSSPELQSHAVSHHAVTPDSPNPISSRTAAANAAGKAAMSNETGKGTPTMPPPTALGSGLLSTRSRKGSLRKNILRKGSMQHMETILSPRIESRISSSTDNTDGSALTGSVSPDLGQADGDYPTPRASYDGAGGTTESRRSSQSSTSRSPGRNGDLRGEGSIPPAPLSRSSTLGDTSTTDEDERPPGSSSSNGSSVPGMTMTKRSSTVSDSYFPPQIDHLTGLGRRPSPMKTLRMTKSSPLSALPLDAASPGPLSPEAWDYSETEWWGWIILVVTWITFVVGMGSCFGAWSWAWDVGETPYAPPELEDDPTLPIVGYYPALIVLTGVMAWVWVITAWVGMKYFKHAKMAGDDG